MDISLRSFLRTTALAAGAVCFKQKTLLAEDTADGSLRPARLLMDMVHNNPGETPFVSHYNDPKFLNKLGYQTKVYELFQGAQFGIDWSEVDPDLFPAGTEERAWIDAKAAELDQLYTAAKSAGLKVFCHTDMVVLPKKLVERYKLTSFRNVSDPTTQKYLRLSLQQIFKRFPQVDGLVIRIGETYLNGAPFHTGGVDEKTSPEKTIIPLMKLLREEVCVGLNKTISFRSWDSFDASLPLYNSVSTGVEPHPNLYISVKHCEDDFHRGNAFSRVLGQGRHNQIVEVQCQREYEGKGAYPNYIAHGVIEGFEEHHGQSIRKIWANPIISGMFTWSRGGGWKGPYITNELWCDLNVYVLAHWARDPNRTEEGIFNDFCSQVLLLSPSDTTLFRRLALLSSDAVYRGIRSSHNLISPWWTRDQYMGLPPLPDRVDLSDFLREKDEAVRMWKDILVLGETIHFPDPAVQEYVVTSCHYGLYLYQIYRAGFQIAAGLKSGDKALIARAIPDYDQAWIDFKNLKASQPSCATLYTDMAFREKPGIGAMVNEARNRL